MTPAATLLGELRHQRIDYVVVRGGHLLAKTEPGTIRVLVPESQLDAFEAIAMRLSLKPQAQQRFERIWTADGEHSAEHLRIAVTTVLRYGRLGFSTGPHEAPVLRRARWQGGVAVASPGDELVDLVLHCILDLESVPAACRDRVAELVADLRANPAAAGRAAERIQQELAPALEWSELLADVLQDRWDDLLARRPRIARQLLSRAPLGTLRGLRRPRTERSNGPHDTRAVVGQNGVPSAAAVSRKQIRGSGLMLLGRGLASGLKFASDLIVVRYLTPDQYGSWTYALAAVVSVRALSALGLHRAIARYLPVHLERGEVDKFYGVLAVVISLTALAGAAVVAAFWAFPGLITGLRGVAAGQSFDLLYILIFFVPLDALDNIFQSVCAALGMSRQLFFRRFLLYPGLRILIALVLVSTSAGVTMLAWGYVVAALLGVGYYAWSVIAKLRTSGLLRRPLLRGVTMPFRRVLAFSTSAMAADWFAVLMTTAGPLLLGYFGGMSAVALYQVVIPVAALNHLVPLAFTMLFEPSASRLVARGDGLGLERHYWRTAMWVSVMSFPLFALSFTAAVPLTVLLFGERYAAAAPILSVIALAQFIEVAAGFNAETLRVSGKIRWLIAANVTGLVVLVGVSAVLIPRMGPLGAGIGTAAGQICYTILKQAAVRFTVGVKFIDPEHSAFYLTVATTGAALLAVRLMYPANLWLIVPTVAIGVVAVFVSIRRSLSISETFPELGRIPLTKKILG